MIRRALLSVSPHTPGFPMDHRTDVPSSQRRMKQARDQIGELEDVIAIANKTMVKARFLLERLQLERIQQQSDHGTKG